MFTLINPRVASMVLGLSLGVGLLSPPSAQAAPTAPAPTEAAPTEAGSTGSTPPGPGVPAPLGEVVAQPLPGEGEKATLASAATGMPQYTISDLGHGDAGFAAEVNEDGVVAGTIFPGGAETARRHAVPVVWTGGVRTSLDAGDAASPIVHAGAIGDDGTVGGWEYDVATGTRYAVRWERGENGRYGPKERISPVRHSTSDGSGGEVQTINAAGVLHVTQPKDYVSGHSDLLWQDGGFTELGGIPGQYPYAETWDMNQTQQVAGALSTGTRMDAATWDGGPQVLPRLVAGSYLNQALALNDQGDIVLESFNPDASEAAGQDRRVIAVGQGSSWTRIPELYGDDDRNSNLFPTDINNRGDVVGEALIGFSDRQTTFAWLYRDGELIDLNTLVPAVEGWELNAAYSINERGQIVGVGTRNGVRRPFLLDPTRPLVFVPGAGASILKSYDNIVPQELWVGCGKDRMRLSTFPEDDPDVDVRAVDATRYMRCYGADGRTIPLLDAYGTMLDRLTGKYGYREYRVDERVERFTTEGCDLSQRSEAPNLFVFAYDWRQDNRISAEELADFIGCIERFYPDTEIDVLTHSMGSLVARRHILNNPGRTNFHKVVTVGAPWLGAPKLVNVLNTGDFAWPVAYGPDVAHIVSGFAAAHQLMSGPLYHLYAGAAFEEDGWDYDGDGEEYEEYDWANLQETFDRRWSRTTPAATAAEFQSYGGADGQADWSADSSGIDYVHIYGHQSGENTLGRTLATTETDCSWLPPFRCITRKIHESTMTVGDGTVPIWSADRMPPGADLNAPGAKLVRIDGTNWWDDHSVEHTTLTRHPDALRAMIAAFHDHDAQLNRMAATATDESSAATPYRYVTVTGAADVVLSDGRGNSDAPLGPGARAPLPGTQHVSQGEGSELVTMPQGVDHPWTVGFTGRGVPMSVGMVAGTQSAPKAVVRWRDLVLDGGQVAELLMTPTGTVTLRVDSDGDGAVDEMVPPTSDTSGADASDTEAPVVSLSQMPVLGQQRLVINATDGRDGSGVETIWYSTERGVFQEYEDSFTAPASATVLAFAEDRAGNRSAMAELDVAAAESGPLTRAVLDPAPNAAGWVAGTTTARLVAVAGDSPVVELRWRSTGAQSTEETVVEGASTEVTVTEPGRTTLFFQAVAEDGTVEPWREQVVRVDASAPTSRLRSPTPGAVVSSLTHLAGTAADDQSGVRKVEVLLERTGDTRYWDGDSWETDRTWLAAAGTTTWRTTSVPSGTALTPGGYAVRVRVSDNAGRVVTSQANTVTVDHRRGLTMVRLELAPGTQGYSSGIDLDDRGVVVGMSLEGTPTRWTNGSGTALQMPPGIPKLVPSAIAPDGSISGHVPASTTPGGRAVRWDPDGTPHLLPSLPGDPSSMRTHDISAAGVVGSAGSKPVWWPTDDRVVPLALPSGYRSASPEGIDDHGTIVGTVADTDGVSRAAVWSDEGRTMTVIGTPEGMSSYGTAINDVGQVVGTVQVGRRAWRPFVLDLWSGEPMRTLYVPTDGMALPHDVADDGTIVGEYAVGEERRGFAIVGGMFRTAQDLVTDDSWTVHRFNGINELGQLTGFGASSTGYGGFLATAPHAPAAQDAVVDTDAGQPVEITLTAIDPDPGTTLTREVVDGPDHGTLSAVSGELVTYTPAAGFSGTDTFTWRSHDATLGSNVATVTVRVRPGADTNQHPVAVVTAAEVVPEGGVVQLDASASYDADGTVTSYAWDLDEDGQFDDASGVTAELPVPREGVRAVSLRVTDGEGATGTAGTSVRVVNVAPLVSVPTAVEAEVGEPVEVVGSFGDPGADDWSATADTGSGHAPLALDGRAFQVTATFEEPGDHPVEVRVCDGTDCGSAVTVVTVREPLAARIKAPSAAVEGDRVELDATGSTGSPTAYAWDLDGDGEHDDATGATASLVLDQDGTYTVGLQATAAGGEQATATHDVRAANVLPVVALPATATAVAGRPWSLTGSFTDPGRDAWTATVDTGEGARPIGVTGRTFEVTHTFGAAGTRSVPVTVCDDDGCGTATTVVTVTAEQPGTWPWQGFFAPVDMMPVVNTVKAGLAIPMKFSLGGDRGLAIFAEGSPVSVRHGCDTSAGTDAIETTVTPGASELSYDAGTGRYQYVWKTQKAWAGQCRTFRMTLADGSVHEAEFRLR